MNWIMSNYSIYANLNILHTCHFCQIANTSRSRIYLVIQCLKFIKFSLSFGILHYFSLQIHISPKFGALNSMANSIIKIIKLYRWLFVHNFEGKYYMWDETCYMKKSWIVLLSYSGRSCDFKNIKTNVIWPIYSLTLDLVWIAPWDMWSFL